jgi:electron transfer flavoprotein beta subunit
MKAKKKPIEKVVPEDLSADLNPILETLKVTDPPARKGGQKVLNRCHDARCST